MCVQGVFISPNRFIIYMKTLMRQFNFMSVWVICIVDESSHAVATGSCDVCLPLYLACWAQASFKQRVEGCTRLPTRETKLCQRHTQKNTKIKVGFPCQGSRVTNTQVGMFTFDTSFILQNFIHHLFWQESTGDVKIGKVT